MRPLLALALAATVLLATAAPSGAVIGGRPTVDGEGPWTVALIDGQSRRRPVEGQFCGAALIRPRFAVTAGHCLQFSGRIFVTRTRVLPRRGGRIVRVVRKIIHPGFRSEFEDESGLGSPNDIALVKLRRPLPGPYLRLPGSGDGALTATGTQLDAFGWGNRSRIGPNLPRQLHVGTLGVFSDATCDDRYGRAYDERTMLCAGGPEGAVDTCEGDSGGPVVGNDATGRGVLVGVTAFGFECGLAEFPGVYTRVSRYAKFLRDPPARRKRKRDRPQRGIA